VTTAVLATLGVTALAGPVSTAGAASTSAPDAPTLYAQAVAATKSWSVHYASVSKSSSVMVLVSGDSGPASGTQQVATGKTTLTDNLSIVVIGGFTYIKGNATGLQNLAGFDPTDASAAAGQWIEFGTDNATFAQVVVGVRSHDVAQELALKGPYTSVSSKTINGIKVDGVEGTQKLSGRTPVHVVLYVRATGAHVPVEEDSVNAHGQPTGLFHATYSAWGEKVRPQAPHATVTIGPVSAV
jgi:hypothetical protein